MNYQLVLQFPAPSDDDFDAMISFENELIDHLGDAADVDGHDWGSGEFNIFIWTGHPEQTFAMVKALPVSQAFLAQMRVAYRAESSETFTVLYPPELAQFSIS